MGLADLRIDRTRKQKSRRKRSPWIARGLFLAAVVVLFLVFRRPLTGFLDRVRLPEVEVSVVTAPAPGAAGAVRGMAANGYVVAARRAALSADTPGRIVEMRVREGSVVKKGEIVARLFSDEIEAMVRRAEAELTVARAGLARGKADLVQVQADRDRRRRRTEAAEAARGAAESRLELRRTQHERAMRLLSDGVINQSELDDAQTAFESADADLRAAEADRKAAKASERSGEAFAGVAQANLEIAAGQVDVARAALDQAEATLDKTIVRAPFDGVVVLKAAEVGEVVSPNSQGGSSARGSVVTMVDFASLEVQANVPETSLNAVRIGAPCSVYLDAYPDVPYAGRVDRIWPTADRQKGTIEVRVVFLDPDERLRPELGVRVVFLESDEPVARATESERGLLIAEDAVVPVGERSGVFVLERDVAKFRELALGERRGGKVLVTAGLTEGERIILKPPASLGDGDRVRVKE